MKTNIYILFRISSVLVSRDKELSLTLKLILNLIFIL